MRIALALHRHSPPSWISGTTIGSGYAQRTDAAAFVLGPTGVGLGRNGTLYVAETLTSRIFGIRHAVSRSASGGTGFLLTRGGKLNMPLGLTIAPNGDVLTVNGGNGRIVETTRGGVQVDWRFLDTSGSPRGAGALFGLAVRPGRGGVYYVDDATNTLRLLH
jgi:hypothetical protein